MSGNSHLFQLIKTLTPGEVKHFRKEAGRFENKGSNNYLRLFETLLGREDYDERAIKAGFAGEGLEKHFANVKRYLYRRLLAFLAMRAKDADPRAELEELLHQAGVLWGKGLYDQSEKLFRRCSQKAQEANLFDLETEALIFLVRDRVARQSHRSLDAVRELTQAQQTAQRRYQERVQLLQLESQLFLLARQFFGMAKPEAIAQGKALMQHPLLQGPSENIDFFEGKRLRLGCEANFADLQGDARQNSRIAQSIVDLWESHPEMIRLYRNRYRLALANLLGRNGALTQFDVFPETLEKLHALPAASHDEEGEVFQNTAFFELLYLINTLQFEVGRERLPDIEKGLAKFADKINPARQLAFRYNIMVLYLLLEDYRKALRQLNLILNDARTEHRQDIQALARIFLLIFHFELGNIDLLDYLFRSAYRYLYSRGNIGRFEKAILSFLRKSANLNPGRQMLPAFTELKEELEGIENDPEERQHPGISELILWLKGKIEQRPLVEIVKRDGV